MYVGLLVIVFVCVECLFRSSAPFSIVLSVSDLLISMCFKIDVYPGYQSLLNVCIADIFSYFWGCLLTP